MWSYSRIDTVKRPDILKLVRKAGIKWLAVGIESGDKSIRLEVAKGKFEDVDVKEVIKKIHEADINVMGNYIFGLPGDTKETMRKTFDLSKELCTAGWNTYTAWLYQAASFIKMHSITIINFQNPTKVTLGTHMRLSLCQQIH